MAINILAILIGTLLGILVALAWQPNLIKPKVKVKQVPIRLKHVHRVVFRDTIDGSAGIWCDYDTYDEAREAANNLGWAYGPMKEFWVEGHNTPATPAPFPEPMPPMTVPTLLRWHHPGRHDHNWLCDCIACETARLQHGWPSQKVWRRPEAGQ